LRVLFIEPEIPFAAHATSAGINLGLACLIGYLKAQTSEIEPSLISFQLKRTILGSITSKAKEILNISPDVIALSTITASLSNALEIAHIGKENHATVVMGGVAASLFDEEILKKNRSVDFIVRGKGEEAAFLLLDALQRGTSEFEQLPSLSFRSKNGDVVRSESKNSKKFAECSPDFSLFPVGKIQESNLPAPIEVNRGCPFNCFFCSLRDLWGTGVERKPTDRVLRELFILRNMGFSKFKIVDSTFTYGRRESVRLLKTIASEINDVDIEAETRVDKLDKELLIEMRKAGINEIIIGVEDTFETNLVSMRKTTMRRAPSWKKEFIKVVQQATELGITLHPVFMLGWPGQTKTALREIADLAIKIGQNVLVRPYLAFVTPHPGSRLWQFSEKIGLKIITRDFSKYTHLYPVALPDSLGSNALKFLIDSYNEIRLGTNMAQRNPCIDIDFVRSYTDRPY
jgi:radical SAM superfamily enzyme YgiQ (UPF0313 family)